MFDVLKDIMEKNWVDQSVTKIVKVVNKEQAEKKEKKQNHYSHGEGSELFLLQFISDL